MNKLTDRISVPCTRSRNGALLVMALWGGLTLMPAAARADLTVKIDGGITAGGEYFKNEQWWPYWSEESPFFTIANNSDAGVTLTHVKITLPLQASGDYYFYDVDVAPPGIFPVPYNPYAGNSLTATATTSDGTRVLDLAFAPGTFVTGLTHRFGIDIDPWVYGVGWSDRAVYGDDLNGAVPTTVEFTFLYDGDDYVLSGGLWSDYWGGVGYYPNHTTGQKHMSGIGVVQTLNIPEPPLPTEPVPAPGAAVLGLVGIGLMGFWRLRRRHAA